MLSLVVVVPVLGVQTSHWTQTNEADFKNGTLQNVVATNLGDLKLSRAVKTLLDKVPQKRAGTAEEVAAAAVWLCSDAASYINGHMMAIDGGCGSV